MSGFLRLSFLAVLSALCSTWGAAAWSQAIDLGRGGSGTPIEITASNGIEWDRDAKRYVATGNAAARQGDTSVYGDRLVAWYREAATGGTEIFRYEAIGNVRFETPTQKVEGDRGIFDVDSEVVVVTGRALRLTTPTDTLTARDTLEYWAAREIAVARGNAMIVSGERRMTADVMTAHFVQQQPQARTAAAPARGQQNARSGQRPATGNAPGGNDARLQRVEAFGNVHVSTPTEIARGDRGVYNMQTSIAQLAGNVRLTRGDNQMAGDFGEVNMNTGISRLLSAPGSGDGRVRGLLIPQQARP
ncbi:MAG: LptA/OstA family protein [Rhodospirillales bacterium]|jgi:lipopolysaccharide export system protein LptA